MSALRVVLTDDHVLVRAGIRSLLEALPDIEVVGEAGDGQQALQLIEESPPDVLLLDVTLPGLNGLSVAARLAKSHPQVKIIVLTVHANEEYVRRALAAGASGYLLKSASVAELELALRAVARGETYLCSELSQRVVDDYIRRAGHDEAPPPLTPRQTEILQLIAEGHSTRQIASRLGLSVKTIETHRSQIGERLGIEDLAGLVRYAIRVGLVPGDKT